MNSADDRRARDEGEAGDRDPRPDGAAASSSVPPDDVVVRTHRWPIAPVPDAAPLVPELPAEDGRIDEAAPGDRAGRHAAIEPIPYGEATTDVSSERALANSASGDHPPMTQRIATWGTVVVIVAALSGLVVWFSQL